MASALAVLGKVNALENNDDTRRNQMQRHWQIRATRIYFFMLIICLIGLSWSLWWTKITSKFIINDPTIDQVANVPPDGQCPCSRIAVSYGSFVTLKIDQHAVCSSDFVTDRWIKAIFPGINGTWLYRGDFRASASAQFLLLRSLCQLSNQHFQDKVLEFYGITLINSQALSRSALISTVKSSIAQFQSTSPFSFQTQLNLINQMIHANKWINGIQTNTQMRYYNTYLQPDLIITGWFIYYNKRYVSCVCQRSSSCGTNAFIFEPTLLANSEIAVTPSLARSLLEIPNFYIGCMPINMLLLSSLECFYNQTCINLLISLIPTNETFTAIRLENGSRFTVNETLQTIVNAMMIKNWTEKISYENYFQECAPKYCNYPFPKTRSILMIVTEVISLLGGLTLVVRTMIFMIFQAFHQNRGNRSSDFSPSFLRARILQWIAHGKKLLMEFNRFQRRGVYRGLTKYQILGTRIYLLAVFVSAIILSMYIFIIEDEQRETIFKPTESKYSTLLKNYQTSLNCPCKNVSIYYDKFIYLEPTYHHICSSSYISEDWLNYTNMLMSSGLPSDQKASFDLGTPFQFIAIVCKYSKESIEEALKLFFQNQLVTFHVTSPSMFSFQMQTMIDAWISDTNNQYQLELDLIRVISEGNKYSNFFSNFKFRANRTTAAIDMIPNSYDNCSCDESDKCYAKLNIGFLRLVLSEQPNNSVIEDFFIGCSNFQSLSRSSLSCFYNQTCIDAIQNHINQTARKSPVSFSYNMTAMDPSFIEAAETHEVFEAILNRLMIRRWKSNVSFGNYYKACAPSFCTFDSRSRRSMIHICLTVISVIGGLSTSIQIFILLLIRTVEKIVQHETKVTAKAFIVDLFQIRNEHQIINRVQFIFLILLLAIFYFLSLLASRQITIEINRPSLPLYETLFNKYASKSFECSCSTLSIAYKTFLTIQPRFHPICSSDFISENWLKYIYKKTYPFLQFDRTDFYRTAHGQFRLLTSFCQLSRQTVNNALVKLNKTSYINGQLLTSEKLRKEVENVIERFQNNTPRLFVRLMNLVREITEGNMIMSLYATNWKMQDLPIPSNMSYLPTEPIVYDSCVCGVSTKCTKSSRNMTAACYPLEALFHSTLHCFYNQTCIDENGLFPALNQSTMNTRFNLNTKFEELVENLFVEEYKATWSYENYFNECSISSCSYSYQGRENTLDIVTSLIGLYGGLTILSEWITLFLVRLYIHRRRNRILNLQ